MEDGIHKIIIYGKVKPKLICEGECVDVFVCVLDHFLILIVMRCHVQVITAHVYNLTGPASVLSCSGQRI